jgi:hypothetical protein
VIFSGKCKMESTMPVFDLFSKRQKRQRGVKPDVYTYDNLPADFRVQIVHIIRDAIGSGSLYEGTPAFHYYQYIHQTLCREYGVFSLDPHCRSNDEAVFNFMLKTDSHEQVLDVIDLCFKVLQVYTTDLSFQYNANPKITLNDAIAELNIRFKEHSIGYQFESNELMRIDSTFIHSEVIKPTLSLLSNNLYKGANEEFLKAHEHYRHGRNKECLNECLKSFESVMKSICDKHKWAYNPTDTSKKLIDICLSKEIIPSYLQSQFTSFKSLLESGIPTIRNRLGGHGQGPTSTDVKDYVASYALHLTASNIYFLMKAEENI